MKKSKSEKTKSVQGLQEENIPETLPVLSLMSSIIFPHDVLSLEIARKLNLNTIKNRVSEGGLVALVLQKDLSKSEISSKNLSRVGVACRVINKMNLTNNTVQAVFQGIIRIEIEKIIKTVPCIVAKVKPIFCPDEKSKEITLIIRKVMQYFEELVSLDEKYPKELITILKRNIQGPCRFDLVATYSNFAITEKQKILEVLNCRERLLKLASMLGMEVKKLKIESDIIGKIEQDLDKSQKEYFLRQQLKIIKKELGEEEPQEIEIKNLIKNHDIVLSY